MSATTSELLDSYTKMLDSEFYKNLKGITAGIEALQKSLVGSDLHKQMQAWQTVLNDPESSINKSMQSRLRYIYKYKRFCIKKSYLIL